jgi:methylenetetrahydrofolate dehydrogenase (NADP+)/methenyltetrahydrofolate cyclohydrolase
MKSRKMMKANIFQGRRKAFEIELELIGKVSKLKSKNVTPKLVSILIGNDKSNKQYMFLKKKAAERVGMELQVKSLSESSSIRGIINIIEQLNKDKSIHGVMAQLPLPESFSREERDEIINSINPGKDVDGMRDDSLFITPAVKAVMTAVKEASNFITGTPRVVVVGEKGFLGGKIIRALKEMDYEVFGLDIETKDLAKETKNADIIISVTGQKRLITGKMIKDKAVVIDVGAPNGDVVFDEAVKKASFITPVPGGIGPVTISCLLENLVEAAERLHKRA